MSIPSNNHFKRHKADAPVQRTGPTLLNKLPNEMWSFVLSFFSFRDQIHFEQTNYAHAGTFEWEWKQKRIAERYSFDWKTCRWEKEKEKWNYSLTKALLLFREKFPAGLITKFPLLDKTAIQQASDEGYGGESLSYALSEFDALKHPDANISNALALLKRAIRQGATLVSSLVTVPPQPPNTQPEYDLFAIDLAIEAREIGNPTHFQNLIAELTREELSELGKRYFTKKKYSRADLLITESLKLYANNPTASVLAGAGAVKGYLEQWVEADELTTRAIARYKVDEVDCPPFMLINAAWAKFKLVSNTKMPIELLQGLSLLVGQKASVKRSGLLHK